jgi:hypothetical protein
LQRSHLGQRNNYSVTLDVDVRVRVEVEAYHTKRGSILKKPHSDNNTGGLIVENHFDAGAVRDVHGLLIITNITTRQTVFALWATFASP